MTGDVAVLACFLTMLREARLVMGGDPRRAEKLLVLVMEGLEKEIWTRQQQDPPPEA